MSYGSWLRNINETLKVIHAVCCYGTELEADRLREIKQERDKWQNDVSHMWTIWKHGKGITVTKNTDLKTALQN